MNRLFTAGLIALSLAGTAFAQSTGGITPALLSQMRQAEKQNPADKALSGALFATDINTITRNAANPVLQNKSFSNSVKSSGITDQKSSGRCWLFTGLNVMRARMIEHYGLGDFSFSQCYCFFYDQLEK